MGERVPHLLRVLFGCRIVGSGTLVLGVDGEEGSAGHAKRAQRDESGMREEEEEEGGSNGWSTMVVAAQ